MATPINAQGCTFTIENSGGTPVTVGGIQSFSGLDGEANVIDVTTLASTAEEIQMGIPRFGNFSLELVRDPSDSGQSELESAKNAQAQRTCVLTTPGGTTFTFDAFVLSLTLDGGVDGVLTGSANLRITGAVTIA